MPDQRKTRKLCVSVLPVRTSSFSAGMLTSAFMLLKTLKLKNTLWAMILPYIAFRLPVSIMLIRSFFVGISKEMEEAAIIDGATLFQIYKTIYLPLSKPIMSTVIIMTAYYAWNEFVFATIFVDSSSFVPFRLV